MPHILQTTRRKEYVPKIAEYRLRQSPEEASQPPELDNPGPRPEDAIIDVLIVPNSAKHTVRIVEMFRRRLNRYSTVVLIHNGMGVLPKVQNIFDEDVRPNIVEAFSQHGVSMKDEFVIDHWASEKIHLSIVPRLDEKDLFNFKGISASSLPSVINYKQVHSDLRLKLLGQNDKYRSLVFIIRKLLGSSPLNCTLRAYLPDFYVMQTRRTVIHSILHTLAAVQRCTYGELIGNKVGHSLIGKMITEVLPVFESDPLISSSKIYAKQFTFIELYRLIQYMAFDASSRLGPLLEDIKAKRETELGFYAGYIIRLAAARGIKLPRWSLFKELVEATTILEFNRWNQLDTLSRDGGVKDIPEWMYAEADRYWEVDRAGKMETDRVGNMETVRKPRSFDIEDNYDEAFMPQLDDGETWDVSESLLIRNLSANTPAQSDSPARRVQTSRSMSDNHVNVGTQPRVKKSSDLLDSLHRTLVDKPIGQYDEGAEREILTIPNLHELKSKRTDPNGVSSQSSEDIPGPKLNGKAEQDVTRFFRFPSVPPK